VIDQGQNGRVISPGYTDDPSGSVQREDQPAVHMIGDNIQVNILLLICFMAVVGKVKLKSYDS